MFTEKDLQQLKSMNISVEKANWQLQQFITGVSPTALDRPAAVGDGIIRVSDVDGQVEKCDKYQGTITKFVPASGAASRMFKALFETYELLCDKKLSPHDLPTEVRDFIDGLNSFAFYNELMATIPVDERDNPELILKFLLSSQGLDYGELPKGLLLFHKDGDAVRTPFEEHLIEGALYARDKNRNVRLHFTVSPEHLAKFKELYNEKKTWYEREFQVNFQVEFSVQSESTDTISVDMANKPFRLDDGSILFRPGGHGALIENLGTIDSDLIFIKNIDNVVPYKRIDTTVTYKKVLAGLLISVQESIYGFQEIVMNNAISPTVIADLVEFFQRYFFIDLRPILKNVKDQKQYLKKLLFRPIRVAGVVKNVGEPGGGPHWVKHKAGQVSLQIVESSQIDTINAQQVKLFKDATHFNPVDIVCGTKDFKGSRYNLSEFVDYDACFISQKSKSGKDLKALELPGLWNGAMANWNTLFVEVPIATFNPVKTVNDLLREIHQ